MIKFYSEAVEAMWNKGDENVVNAVEATALEYLKDEVEVWQRVERYNFRDFRCLIMNSYRKTVCILMQIN